MDEIKIKTAGPRMAGVGQMWAMAVGGELLTLSWWLALIALSNTTDGTGMLFLTAFIGWLCGIGLILRTAYDLARYKGRRHRLWIGLALFSGLVSFVLPVCWLPLFILALLPNRRVEAEAAPAVRSNGLDGLLAHLARQAGRWYWRVFLLGVVAYILAMYQLTSDDNLHMVPLVLLLASALVPITFVIFCWEENTLADLPLTIVGVTFLIGASLSLFVADVLEGMFATGPELGQWVMVGICEETAKALALCCLLRNKRLRGEIHGLILGAAAGMGFATLETAGYGFDWYQTGVLHALGPHATPASVTEAGISLMTSVLVTRMALAVFGHGVWTAIIGAAIWRDRGAATFKLTRGVALACGIAVTLHALWDASPWLMPVSAILGILVLRFLIGESVSRAQLGPAAPSPEPLEQALQAYFRHPFKWGMARVAGSVHSHGTRPQGQAPEVEQAQVLVDAAHGMEAARAVHSNALDGKLDLAELHAAGVLSAEEFAQAKQRLLVP